MHVAVHANDLAVIKKFVAKLTSARLQALLNTMDKTVRTPRPTLPRDEGQTSGALVRR